MTRCYLRNAHFIILEKAWNLLPNLMWYSPFHAFHSLDPRNYSTPFKAEGVDIELSDFDDMFIRLQEVSPLARSVIMGANTANVQQGFAGIDDKGKPIKILMKIDSKNFALVDRPSHNSF